LIINGSFEDPIAPTGGYITLDTGSTVVTGWTVVGTQIAVVNETYSFSGVTFNAQDGKQTLDLTGSLFGNTSSGVKQIIPTTIDQTYNLELYVGSADGGYIVTPSAVDLSIDDGPRVNFSNPATPTTSLDWKLFTTSFVATNSTTSLTFFPGNASEHISLDNVSLSAVPGPLPLLGVGYTFLWSRRLKKRMKKEV
jgi:hypothetical protein